jgi:methionyl-tRNA formyltransferase
MRIACVGYREWALDIYDNIEKEFSSFQYLRISSKKDYNKQNIRDFNPDIILFYGWSWFIDNSMLNDYMCVMLHPSSLPLYRGGSPIQNQIINGEIISSVTLFVMNEDVDAGPILYQGEYSLLGELNEILDRISDIGYLLTRKMFIERKFIGEEQEHNKATFYKRRKKEESCISAEELRTKSAIYLYNKIRMLQEPYPNAYILTADNKKLFITKAYVGHD